MARNEHSGHPMKWFKDQNSARSSFECAICLEVLKDPVQVRDCGHQFCELCMDDILKTDARCPSCRIVISRAMVFKDYAANRLIRKLEVNCCNQGCSWTGSLSSYLEEHINCCSSLAPSINNNDLNVKQIERQVESLMAEFSTLKLRHKNIEGQMKELKTKHQNEIKGLKTEHKNEVKKLKSKHEEDINLLKKEITELRALSHCSGTYTMEISGFNRKLAQAKSSGGPDTIMSVPFYSSHDGYKLRLQVHLNEAYRGFSGYMGVYIRLMKSDHDGMLTWPFDKKCTFTLIAQGFEMAFYSQDHSMVLHPGKDDALKRPQESENMGYGFPRFILHSKLCSGLYILEDTVYIRVKVEP